MDGMLVDAIGPKRHVAPPAAPVAPPIPPPSRGGIVEMRASVKRVVERLGPSLGNVFLIPQPWIGMVLWLAVASNPRLAAFGLLGLGVSLAGERALGIAWNAGLAGGLRANALLTATAAGWMTAPTIYSLPVQVAIAAAASTAAFVLAAALTRRLKGSEWPSLLWGYCLTAGALFAMFPVGTMLASHRLTWWHIPPASIGAWIDAFFRSIGSLMFAPSIEVGALVIGAILLWSRAAFIAGMVGWMAGAAVAVGIQQLGVTYYWLPAAHNYFVAGMALGALFILPGCSSLLLAAFAGAVASLFDAALQSQLPAFAYLPMASALTIWTGLGTLALAAERRGFRRNHLPGVSPEEAWWRATTWAQRFGRNEPLLVVPANGPVLVAQGFDGPLSHTGRFRHALDFVQPPPQQMYLAGSDVSAADTIWNAPVIAPAGGIVERVRDGIADNPLGRSNFAESWGNHVVIRLDQGGWALLAHLRQGSVAVQPGTRVEIGTYLGAVGNSGRSPVPHLHLQVQDGPHPGAATVPFRLANYRSSLRPGEPLLEWTAAEVPQQNMVIAAAAANPSVHAALASLLPGTSIWSVATDGTIPRSFRERQSDASLQVQLRLDAEGRHCFECRDGTLISALAPDAWRMMEQRGASPFLRLLAHGSPSIPYAAHPGLSWSDLVPALPGGRAHRLALLLAPYRIQPFTYARSTCVSGPDPAGMGLTIETVLTPRHSSLPSRIVCRLDQSHGPVSIEAVFDHGRVLYSLVTFTPGLPL